MPLLPGTFDVLTHSYKSILATFFNRKKDSINVLLNLFVVATECCCGFPEQVFVDLGSILE